MWDDGAVAVGFEAKLAQTRSAPHPGRVIAGYAVRMR